jgi:ABC-type branched-subunit amino acid transport system substrate-binding protein
LRGGIVALLALCLVTAACARGDDDDDASATEPTTTVASAPADSTTTTAAVGPGDFGTMKEICGPGDAKGATARGVTDTEIHVGTMGDPTNTVLPGIGQEAFDIGDAFVKWCNDAGGILGRKIVLTKRDAKLFEVGARMIEACQSDFMLVGASNPLDEAGVDARLGCDLAQIPAYVVSAKAALADHQVVINSSIRQVQVGHFKAIAALHPDAFQAVSFISVDGGGLDSFAERQRDAMESLGYKIVDFQLAPVTGVDNWRPYAQNASNNGAKSVITLSPDISAFVRSMTDVGWTPDVMPLGVQNYSDGTIELAKEGVLPKTYVALTYWPFEAADQNPTVQQAIDLIESGSSIDPSFAHLQSLSAWLLWAEAAKACGSNLTGDCVIQHAGTQKGWTGGGIIAPVDTHVGPGVISQCFTLVEATPDGFTLVPDVTKPNTDIFNCDPANVVEVADTHIG